LNAWLMSNPEFPLEGFAFLVVLETPWATAPLTLVLGGLMFGQRPRIGRLARRLLRAVPSLFIHQLLLPLVLIATLFFLVLIPMRLKFLNEVILLEGGPWWRASSRSAQLCARRGANLFAQALAQLFFGVTFIGCFWFGTGAAASGLLTSEMTWDEPGRAAVYGLRFQIALWVAIAFFAVARFLTYIDHRIRKEGWEIKLRLQNVGRSLEEAQAW
jgi:hypothetical protein